MAPRITATSMRCGLCFRRRHGSGPSHPMPRWPIPIFHMNWRCVWFDDEPICGKKRRASQTGLRCRMDELKNLESLGLVLPSPSYLLGALLFGMVGYIAFRRGRKTTTSALTWTGVTLMVYPYAVTQTWLLWVVGAALCVGVYAKWS